MQVTNQHRIQNIYIYILVTILFILGINFNSHAATICNHIWASKYDSNNHWEYCTNCGEIRDKKAHSYTDHWFKSGAHCMDGNYSTRTCACGYSYKYTQECDYKSDAWHDDGCRSLHYKKCSVCGGWRGHQNCANAKGELSCKNPGTCSTCGNVIGKDQHFLWFDGSKLYCKWCNEVFATCSEFSATYNSDHSTCTYRTVFIPKSGHTLKYKSNIFNLNPVISVNNKYTNNSNVIEITTKFTISTSAYKLSSTIYYHGIGFTLDGKDTYFDAIKGGYFDVKVDWNAPTISKIAQTPQKEYLGWTTINKVDITGTEDRSPVVYISISDLSDASNKPATNVAATVTNGKYNFSFTPLLEGATAGRKYRMIVRDAEGNESYKDFIVKKTDCKAPEIISKTKFDGWSGTKTVTLQIRDYGYGYDNGTGSVKVSLNNNSSYKNATLSSKGVYTVTYTFPNETSKLETYNVYLQDGLNNTQITPIYVGYIDNTKPTISSAPITYLANNKGATVKVTASDARSGVYQYGYKYEKDSNITWQTGNTLTLSKYGYYTLYVKDKAGNTQTKPLAIGYIVTYDAAGGTSSKTSDIAALTCSLTDASRKGYTFDGWFDGNTLVGAPGKSYSPGKHVTLKAHWTPIIYYIKYNTYEGELKKEKVVSYTVESPDIVLENPTLDGKEFTGWSDWNDPTPKKPYIIPKGTIGDLIISANWKVDPDSVNGNGGNGGNGSGDNNARFAESSKIKSNKFVME